MKFLFFLLVFVSFSFSTNLLYLEEDNNGGVRTYCINDEYYYDKNTFYFFDLKSYRERSINTRSYQKIVVAGGWELDEYNNCIFDESKYYGLTYEEYNYLMSILGIVWGGFIILAFVLAV